jgi:peptidoglycan hydrolase-like protein with peptidoglycan-binding domain
LPATGNLTANLKLGITSPQVATLQQLLNSAGFYIAKSGSGSPGHESTTFGAMTLAAVERFQCAQNIVCKGTVATTGYGFVGAKTRAALAQAALAINSR